MRTFQKLAACCLCLLLMPSTAALAATGEEPGLRPIHIEVMDAAKNPVSGLTIDITLEDGEACTFERKDLWRPYVTGADGCMDLPAYETGHSYLLTLSNPYSRPELEQTSLFFRLEQGNGPHTLQLCWEKEAPEETLRRISDKLVLHFVDEKGAPAENLLVGCERDTFFSDFPPKFFTGTYGQEAPCGPDGRLILLSPFTGSYTVTARYSGSSTCRTFLVPYAGGSREYILPLRPGLTEEDGSACSSEQTVTDIAVQVIDAAGNAVPDAVVSAEPLRTPKTGDPLPLRARKAGKDGVYRNQAIFHTTYTLCVQNNLLSPALVQKHELSVSPYAAGQAYTVVFDGEPPLTTLKKMTEKTVLYFQLPSGQPAAGLRVTVKRADTGKMVSSGWTDYEGKYLFLQARPAAYILTAADEAAGTSEQYTIDTTPGGDLRFELGFPQQSE